MLVKLETRGEALKSAKTEEERKYIQKRSWYGMIGRMIAFFLAPFVIYLVWLYVATPAFASLVALPFISYWQWLFLLWAWRIIIHPPIRGMADRLALGEWFLRIDN